MFKYLSLSLALAVLLFPTALVHVYADDGQEDQVEDEVVSEDDDEVTTEDETDEVEEEKVEPEEPDTSATGKDADDEDQPQGIRMSPDVTTAVLFPDFPDKQLPAGEAIYVLIGFHNKGEKDFIVETIDASFRYPQDYSYHIQNFTGTTYNTVVQPGHEASFNYAFHPHESYGGRPFGLTVLLMYKDSDGNQFGAGVFNETITFKEVDDTFDGETFFLYVLLAAVALLLVFGLNYAFTKSGFKRSLPKAVFETGTQNGRTNVDYDWIPKETTDFSKASPRQSPRRRRVKRSTGSGESE